MQDGPDTFVLTEAEKDQLKRKRQSMTVDSPPATQRSEDYEQDPDEPEDIDEIDGEGEEEDEVDDEEAHDQPDLQAYFDLYDIPDERVISMCRAFASYLVSLRPKTPSKTPASRSGREPEPPSQKKPHWLAKRLPWKKPRKNG